MFEKWRSLARIISRAPAGDPKILFSMISWRVDSVAPGTNRAERFMRPRENYGAEHYKKETQYAIDYQFTEHLKICPICRRQLLDSLLETYRMIDTGAFWE